VNINWRAPGLVWVEHTGENIIGYGCAAGLSALPSVVGHHTTWADWVVSVGIGALTAALVAGASLKTGNGTASFLPRVVALPASEK
jgi:hypothetical protein